MFDVIVLLWLDMPVEFIVAKEFGKHPKTNEDN
jgi:hypothetical protein